MDDVLCQEASKPHMHVPPLHASSKCGGTPHAHARMHIFPFGDTLGSEKLRMTSAENL